MRPRRWVTAAAPTQARRPLIRPTLLGRPAPRVAGMEDGRGDPPRHGDCLASSSRLVSRCPRDAPFSRITPARSCLSTSSPCRPSPVACCSSSSPAPTSAGVSTLLGHTSITVTERHYAPWVKARRDQLEQRNHQRAVNTSPLPIGPHVDTVLNGEPIAKPRPARHWTGLEVDAQDLDDTGRRSLNETLASLAETLGERRTRWFATSGHAVPTLFFWLYRHGDELVVPDVTRKAEISMLATQQPRARVVCLEIGAAGRPASAHTVQVEVPHWVRSRRRPGAVERGRSPRAEDVSDPRSRTRTATSCADRRRLSCVPRPPSRRLWLKLRWARAVSSARSLTSTTRFCAATTT